MQYPVLIHCDRAGRYEAVSLSVPTCAGRGDNRDEALLDLKRLLEDWLHSAEMTTIEVETSVMRQNVLSETEKNSLNPWLRMAGIFKDDPVLEEMLEEIYALRKSPETEKEICPSTC